MVTTERGASGLPLGMIQSAEKKCAIPRIGPIGIVMSPSFGSVVERVTTLASLGMPIKQLEGC